MVWGPCRATKINTSGFVSKAEMELFRESCFDQWSPTVYHHKLLKPSGL